MTKIISICAHIPSESPEVTLRFLQNVLGFDVAFSHGSYSELVKDGLVLGVMQSVGIANEQSLYLQLEGLDDFWTKHQEALGQCDCREPFVQEYGMKEIHVVVPGTKTLLFLVESVGH